LQIVRQIELLIIQGVLLKGDQLPTVRNFAIELQINFNTVARAYRVLNECGLISTQRGRGTYIWEKPGEQKDSNVRLDILKTLSNSFIKDALLLGFKPIDIKKEIETELDRGDINLSQN
jgi:GntR family transcriptional regulator